MPSGGARRKIPKTDVRDQTMGEMRAVARDARTGINNMAFSNRFAFLPDVVVFDDGGRVVVD
eukprot:m.488142 g.488142  ORF g.488142 m.488142 type:complete len:62 (+) comp25565_c0_seq1:32-217(+)